MKDNILKNSNFRALYTASFISEVGSFITDTALMLYLFKLAQSNSLLGLSKALFMMFFIIGSIIGGPIGEKFSKKSVLQACEILRIPVILLLLFFSHTPFLIIFCNTIVAFFTGIFNPNKQALISFIMPKKDIPRANALIGSTFAIIHMLGPFLGATLFGYFKGVNEILTFDLLTYILGIFFIAKISLIRKAPVDKDETKYSFYFLLVQGMSFVKKRLDLTSICISEALTGYSVGLLIPLLYPFTINVLGGGEFEFGVLMALFGLGGVIGGAATKLVTDNNYYRILIHSTVIAEAIMFLFWGLNTNYPIACVMLLFWGAIVFFRITLKNNYVALFTQDAYLSRVFALIDMSFVVPNILGAMTVAAFGKVYSSSEMTTYAAIIFIAIMIIRLFFKESQVMLKIKSSSV